MENTELINRLNFLNSKLLDVIHEAAGYYAKVQDLTKEVGDLRDRLASLDDSSYVS